MSQIVVKERPIQMSAPNIRPILEGRKTQTRRIWRMPKGCEWYVSGNAIGIETGDYCDIDCYGWWNVEESVCPYGKPGDALWVKEAWRTEVNTYDGLTPSEMSGKEKLIYEADGSWADNHTVGRYRHARFMPRWASRILLEITEVRIERLNEISEEDAKAEGVSFGNITDQATGEIDCDAVEAYESLWESINGAGSWDANPWVWVIIFKRIE